MRRRGLLTMLLRMLYGCSLRLGEALNLKKSDVDIGNSVLFIRSAKGNRDRFVPLEPTLTNTLSQYYNYLLRDKPNDAWVFESDVADKTRNCIGKPRTVDWAQDSFRRVLGKAGIDLPELPRKQRNICLHCIRHTFIVRSFRKQDLAGIDNYDPAASISVYVGHSNLIGTQRYMHMTAENSIDIINATNEHSKGMFPEVRDEPNNTTKQQDILCLKPQTVIVQEDLKNECSKGMFPEVPH